MIALAFAQAYAGFLALCLAMPRHGREVLQKPLADHAARLVRVGGWTALAASFAASVAHGGWQIGPVLWIALLTIAGALVVLLLSYAPQRMIALACGLLPLSLIAALSGC